MVILPNAHGGAHPYVVVMVEHYAVYKIVLELFWRVWKCVKCMFLLVVNI